MWTFTSPGARRMQAIAKRRNYSAVTEGIRAEIWRGSLVTVLTGFDTRAAATQAALDFVQNDMVPAGARIVIVG